MHLYRKVDHAVSNRFGTDLVCHLPYERGVRRLRRGKQRRGETRCGRPYQTWDEVINRWVGGQVSDLYVELGPPNLHPHQSEDGTIQMIWDFSIDRMPGQADAFNLLPLYGGNVNCQIHFFADLTGKILKGERVGCE